MSSYVLVWDLETVPDIQGFAVANGHEGKSEEEIRAAIGDKFPKLPYHSIICIGALIAHFETDHWIVDSVGAPHVGERSEKELITAFVNRIAELSPQLVTFNGSSFDLPVIRYRAMTHGVAAPGFLRALTSIDTPMMQLTSATFSPRLTPRQKRPCMKFAV